MNWNKFFTGTTDHEYYEDHEDHEEQEDHGNEDETETEDDEEITDSNATVSTDKKSYFLGIGFHRFLHNRLSERCVKFVFLMLNTATFLAGMVGIVTSVWTLTDSRIMSRLIGQRFFITILLFTSLIASFVSLLGILGVLRRRRKFLNIYAFCYLLFLCIIFISAIMSFWIFEEITRRIHDDMVASIESYHSLFSSREAWDNTHRYLKCCGVKSAKDWARYHVDIPKSCCAETIEKCLEMTEAVAYKTGCLRSAVLLLNSYVHAISISALVIFLIKLLNFLLALCILGRMKAHGSNES